MPSGPPFPGIKVPAFTELKVECDGSFGHCGQPIVGPFWNVPYQIRPPLKSPTASRVLSGDTAMPFGNKPLSMILRSIPSREYWYTAPVWSVRFGPGPVPQGSVKKRLPSPSKSRSLGPFEQLITVGADERGNLLRLRVIDEDSAVPRRQLQLTVVPARALRLAGLSQFRRRVAVEDRVQLTVRRQ